MEREKHADNLLVVGLAIYYTGMVLCDVANGIIMLAQQGKTEDGPTIKISCPAMTFSQSFGYTESLGWACIMCLME